MELFKRKRIAPSQSMWIILGGVLMTAVLRIDTAQGLQGVPTWISLGLKSPFIEFRGELEVLANTTVAFNMSAHRDDAMLHRKGQSSVRTFINPSVSKNLSEGSLVVTPRPRATPATRDGGSNSNDGGAHSLTMRNNSNIDSPMFAHNAVESSRMPLGDLYEREITLIEDDVGGGGHSSVSSGSSTFESDRSGSIGSSGRGHRKPITPQALKTATEPRRAAVFQETASNIDDLKRHILMLQNLTKSDQSFQSKFVVFPKLQKDQAQSTPSPQPSVQVMRQYPIVGNYSRTRSSLNTQRHISRSENILHDAPNEFVTSEKITIVPQVLLQNDQIPGSQPPPLLPSTTFKETRVTHTSYSGRKISRASWSTTVRPTTLAPNRRLASKRLKGAGKRMMTVCRAAKNCTQLKAPQQNTFNVSAGRNQMDGGNGDDNHHRPLSRPVRAPGKHSQSGMRNARTTLKESVVSASHANGIVANSSVIGNYKETIDLNPDHCYSHASLTYGQQKLCVVHTSIMPAISRGARAAIQECKHQFKSRRWNCSTVDDDTVFGPITSLGSPEMAFVHALAAAAAASFIARACRDGQLASCGCSRSARPKQLHSDWTWGGCGDDLEFGYKFSQNFVDIREKERKRGARGLVTVPQKLPNLNLEEKSFTVGDNQNVTGDLLPINTLSATISNGGAIGGNTSRNDDGDTLNSGGSNSNSNRNSNSGAFKPEDLLELQEKITKEILSSKLQEKEMHELQAKINREILNSKVFNVENHATVYGERARKGHQKMNRIRNGGSAKARSLMNLHNNEAGRRAVIKKSRVTCKCHGVSGSCSLITCWQQLTSMREIGDFLREKYDAATQVKLNKRGRLQVKDSRFKVPSALDLVYLDESPDWCRNNRALQWPGTHGRVCNKTSSGLDGCAILCCGRGYNSKKMVVKERCNCKFHWCCNVKCETCVKVIEEYTCK